jgi:hypothetical protein
MRRQSARRWYASRSMSCRQPVPRQLRRPRRRRGHQPAGSSLSAERGVGRDQSSPRREHDASAVPISASISAKGISVHGLVTPLGAAARQDQAGCRDTSAAMRRTIPATTSSATSPRPTLAPAGSGSARRAIVRAAAWPCSPPRSVGRRRSLRSCTRAPRAYRRAAARALRRRTTRTGAAPCRSLRRPACRHRPASSSSNAGFSEGACVHMQ